MWIPTSLTVLIVAFLFDGLSTARPANETKTIVVDYTVADWVIPISPYQTKCEDELMDHIRRKVAPSTWAESGGRGTMWYDAKTYRLTVRQTPAVHAELKIFLEQLSRQPISVDVRDRPRESRDSVAEVARLPRRDASPRGMRKSGDFRYESLPPVHA